jgi:hypothetical protein
MIFEDTWHWFLAVILFVELFFWLSKKIVRSIRDLAAAWAETSAKLPARPFIEQSKAEPIKKKDPVFRPGIWMQK